MTNLKGAATVVGERTFESGFNTNYNLLTCAWRRTLNEIFSFDKMPRSYGRVLLRIACLFLLAALRQAAGSSSPSSPRCATTADPNGMPKQVDLDLDLDLDLDPAIGPDATGRELRTLEGDPRGGAGGRRREKKRMLLVGVGTVVSAFVAARASGQQQVDVQYDLFRW